MEKDEPGDRAFTDVFNACCGENSLFRNKSPVLPAKIPLPSRRNATHVTGERLALFPGYPSSEGGVFGTQEADHERADHERIDGGDCCVGGNGISRRAGARSLCRDTAGNGLCQPGARGGRAARARGRCTDCA